MCFFVAVQFVWCVLAVTICSGSKLRIFKLLTSTLMFHILCVCVCVCVCVCACVCARVPSGVLPASPYHRATTMAFARKTWTTPTHVTAAGLASWERDACRVSEVYCHGITFSLPR